jgi:hypothetical protein
MKSALLTVVLSLSLSLPILGAGVDPVLLGLAAPDVRTVVGIQVSQAQATPLGQALMARIQLDAATNKAMADTGFDPRRDLREIVVTLAIQESGNAIDSDVMLFGRGSFNIEKITAAAVSAGAASSTYRGVRLLEAKSQAKTEGKGSRGPSGSDSGVVAFLDASTMLAGETASIKAAIDRHASGAAFTGTLAVRARQVAIGNDAWLVTLPPPAPPAGSSESPFGPLGKVLQSAVQVSMGLKFTATEATLSAEVLTRSPQDAQSMVDLLKFFVQMTQKNLPPGSNPATGPSLANAAQISATGSTMHVMISVPQQELQQFLFSGADPPKKLAAR